MIFTRHAGAVMIFTGSRNAAVSDNSMYCMIPDPFPSTAFGKGSATPDYLILALIIHNQIIFVYIHKYIHALYIMNCSKK